MLVKFMGYICTWLSLELVELGGDEFSGEVVILDLCFLMWLGGDEMGALGSRPLLVDSTSEVLWENQCRSCFSRAHGVATK
jgi:hypothetical protein